MKSNISHFITSVGYGGGERVVLGLASSFKKQFNVRIFSLTHSERFGQECRNEAIEYSELSGVQLVSLSSKEYIKALLSSLSGFFKKMRVVRQSDVIHTHGFPDIILAIIGKFFSSKTRIVYTHHTQMARKGKLSKMIWGFLYGRVDAFTTISSLAKENILINFPHLKIKIIGNWVAPYFFLNSEANTQRDFHAKMNFLSVGRIESIKRPDLILEYFHKHFFENGTLTFIGKGSFEHDLNEKIKSLQLTDKVQIISEVSNESLPKIMKGYDAAMLFGHREGFCIAAAEAIVMNLPVLTLSDCGAINEISKSACVNLDKVDASSLMNDISKAKDACKIVKNDFSYEAVMKKYQDLYEEQLK